MERNEAEGNGNRNEIKGNKNLNEKRKHTRSAYASCHPLSTATRSMAMLSKKIVFGISHLAFETREVGVRYGKGEGLEKGNQHVEYRVVKQNETKRNETKGNRTK